MSYSKYKPYFIITLVLASCLFAYLAFRDREYFKFHSERDPFILSQPTITNTNPIMNGQDNKYYNAYIQPYKSEKSNKKESYSNDIQKNTPTVAELQNGNYMIKTQDGTILNSIAFTPVQCNTMLLNPELTPSNDQSWVLENVSKGIYILKKPNNSECLYASIGDTLKSYLLESGCKKKNVCGLDHLTETKELDPYSKRTYFELWKYGDKYIIKSVSNNKYICLQNNKIGFSDNPLTSCLFDIQPKKI